MDERVTIHIDQGVADVRLNRADKLNAIDPAMFQALAEAGRKLGQDNTVRAVVLSGEGRAFCAGLDFESFRSMEGRSQNGGSELTNRNGESLANRAQLAAWVWTELPVPVIAAIHGFAFGGGLQIALGADIRLVEPSARLSVMEIRWGLIPDMTGTQQLRNLVRLDVAKELTFTGREVLGTEAVEIGLATRVADDPRAEALKMAQEIAARSPDAIRAGKRLLNASRQLSVGEGLELEERLQVGLMGTPNQTEAVRANLEKRSPQFADPS